MLFANVVTRDTDVAAPRDRVLIIRLASDEGKPFRVLFFCLLAPLLTFGGTSPFLDFLLSLGFPALRACRRVSRGVGGSNGGIAVQAEPVFVGNHSVADSLTCVPPITARDSLDERRSHECRLRNASDDALAEGKLGADP